MSKRKQTAKSVVPNRSVKTSSNPFPYRKAKVRIPREISSAASLWLDFFQQFCDRTVDDAGASHTADKAAVERARILADHALAAFQDRFPGVHL